MQGLLLHIIDRKVSGAGDSFWRCFEPARQLFDAHFWVFTCQPWMGAPQTFDYKVETLSFEGIGNSSIILWRPNSIGRWVPSFWEEYIELWAIPQEKDAAVVAAEFERKRGDDAGFIEKRAVIWLAYTDSAYWEIFARDEGLLEIIRNHVGDSRDIRAFDTDSLHHDRAAALAVRASAPRM